MKQYKSIFNQAGNNFSSSSDFIFRIEMLSYKPERLFTALRLFATIFVVSIFSACHTPVPLSKTNIAGLYNPGFRPFAPRVLLVRENDQPLIKVVCSVDGAVYRPWGSSGELHANYRCWVGIRPAYDAPIISDSASAMRRFSKENAPETLSFTFNMFSESLHHGIAEIVLCDVNSGKCQTVFYPLSPELFIGNTEMLPNKFERQSASVILVRGHEISLMQTEGNDLALTVERFSRPPQIPLPPFSMELPMRPEFGPDSVWIQSCTGSPVCNIPARLPRVYHIQCENTSLFLKVLLRSSEAVDAAQSIRYITTADEYKKIFSDKDINHGMARFWTDCSGSTQRAAMMSGDYRARTEQADLLFTEKQEGWSTDRGMIYIVFGPAAFVYRSESIETWIYPVEGDMQGLRFDFGVKKQGNYEEFNLIRKSEYRESWRSAVEGWRR
ncbi:MAG: GWxTD domain-containing protein [Bacteroidales bacterium]|nr:GWxTD domain-containing protein [Bacteroidales bacterium]